MPASSLAPSCSRLLHPSIRFQFPQLRQPSRHRQRIAGERPRLVHRPHRRKPLHDLLPPAKRPHRPAPADHLAERRQIRTYPVQLLRPAPRHAKARHHLVKDQHDPIFRALLPQQLQVARRWKIEARIGRDRLQDDRRDLAPLRLSRESSALVSIKWQRRRQIGKCLWNARAVRLPMVKRPAPAFTSSESACPW